MRSLEAQCLAVIRRVQATKHPQFCIASLRQPDVDQMLARSDTSELPLSGVECIDWAPPLNGFSRLIVPPDLDFTGHRFASFWAVCFHELQGEPPICAHAAATCGIINTEDARLKGQAFVNRKKRALRGDARLWGDYSADFVFELADRVRSHLEQQPRPSPKLRASAAYAFELGVAARKHDRPAVALRRLAKAARLAEEERNWELGSMARVNIGIVHRTAGEPALARATLASAIEYALQHGCREAAGCASHDLFVTALDDRDFASANRYAMQANEFYQPGSARRHALAYDVAYAWLEQGYARRAYQTLAALNGRFFDGERCGLFLATTARAAAAAGDLDAYERGWAAAEAHLPSAPKSVAGQIWYELGLAHAAAGRMERAAAAVEKSLAIRSGRGSWERSTQDVAHAITTSLAIAHAAPPAQAEIDAFAEILSASLRQETAVA